MSVAKFKGNEISYLVRVFCLVYLVPMCLVCLTVDAVRWLVYKIYIAPINFLDDAFPLKGDDDGE